MRGKMMIGFRCCMADRIVPMPACETISLAFANSSLNSSGARKSTVLIFWGLKSVKQVAEAVGIIAREKKIGADKLEFSTAWIKGEDLYIGKGPVVGAKKAVAIFRKGSK